MCLAKKSDLYFTEAERQLPCGKKVYLMPGFWYWHPSGTLDAEICDQHGELFLERGRGYLRERIEQAIRSYPACNENGCHQ